MALNDPRPKPVTPAYLERAAVHYLERFASSAENLRRVLARKARRRLGAEPPAETVVAIAAVVERIVASGLVDDRAYAEGKTASLLRRGTSTRGTRARLKEKGVPEAEIATALAAAEPDETSLARRYAQRRRLGPFRTPPDPARRERDLAALCRAGFPYGAARAALDGPAEAD